MRTVKITSQGRLLLGVFLLSCIGSLGFTSRDADVVSLEFARSNNYALEVGLPSSSQYCELSQTVYGELIFDGSLMEEYTGSWFIEFDAMVHRFDASGSLIGSSPHHFRIDHNPASGVVSREKDGFKIHTALSAVMDIDYGSISTNYPYSNFSSDITIGLKLEAERSRYNLPTPTMQSPIGVFDIETPYQGVASGVDNEVILSWSSHNHVEWYELEWLFVDIGHQAAGDPISYDFSNATRVRIDQNKYLIPLGYPRGYILYRVRAVDRDCSDPKVYHYSAWSSNQQDRQSGVLPTAVSHKIGYGGLEPGMVWEYATTYIENGKHKGVLSFYDGSQRNRQNVTFMNSDDHAVIQSTLYDYRGRPVVEVLPFPTGNQGLQYYHGSVSLASGGGVYSREDFDLNTTVENPTAMSASPGTSAGYYASNAPSVSGVHNTYVPDAQGYPYSRTWYMNDGTDRVRAQSMPGQTHRIQSGAASHDTRMFYGRPSSQAELDRLFGNNVGDVSHYQKHLSKDPNGQISVSYLDPKGNVIATALAGKNPEALSRLESYASQTIEASLNDLNKKNSQGSELIYQITPSVSGDYQIDYTFSRTDFCDDCLSDTQGCTDCKYNLSLALFDEFGQAVSFTVAGEGTSTSFEFENIGNISQAMEITLSLTPQTYTFVKTLSIDKGHIQDQQQAYYQTLKDDLGQNSFACINYSVPGAGCSCEDQCTLTYNPSFGVYLDQDGQPTDSSTAASLIASCQEGCNEGSNAQSLCEVYRSLLVSDLSPGGQYFSNNKVTSPSIPSDYTWLENNVATNPSALAAQLGLSGITAWSEVEAGWNTDWADLLVAYHPEYCTYRFFCDASEGDGPGCTPTIAAQDDKYLQPVDLGDVRMFWPTTYLEGLANTGHTSANDYVTPPPAGYSYTVNPFLDPIETCSISTNTFSGEIALIESLLLNFIDIRPHGATIPEYASIWYLLDFGPGLVSLNLDNDDSEQIIDELFGTDGAITTGAISRQEVFSQFYLSVRTYALYNYLNDPDKGISSCTQSPTFLSAGGGTDVFSSLPSLTPAGDLIRFPWNDFYASTPSPSSNPTYQTTFGSISTSQINIEPGVDFPQPSLQAEACDCANLQDLINDIETSLGSSLPADVNAEIATALNDLYGTSYAQSDVALWRTDCQGSPQISTSLPLELKCQDRSVDPEDPCIYWANWQVKQAQSSYLQKAINLAEKFSQDFQRHCQTSYQENMTVSYEISEYHYTLYFYDQANNLVRTVPPNGVTPLGQADINDVHAYRTTGQGSPVYPSYGGYQTTYDYSSLNQVQWQETPDGGETKFYYDQIGRIFASQDADQAGPTGNGPRYSYSLYDPLGRIVESGQITTTTPPPSTFPPNSSGYPQITAWANTPVRDQITKTYYDSDALESQAAKDQFGLDHRNLRTRISFVTYQENPGNEYDYAAHYGYDVHGNVFTMIHENTEFEFAGQSFKEISYAYDLVSGNVLELHYQKGEKDEFSHRYSYDQDNRIVSVKTSRDGIFWEEDADYTYYPHGPLARVKIGQKQIQGLDYIYTIQGWLKSINNTNLAHDPGQDGFSTSSYMSTAQDVFAYGLNYFSGDYKSLATSTGGALIGASPGVFTGLFNGNIGQTQSLVSNELVKAQHTLISNYSYDQLNRLVGFNAEVDKNLNTGSTGSVSGYGGEYRYDANGNLLSLSRNIHSSLQTLERDDLTYTYAQGNNRLTSITDQGNGLGFDGGYSSSYTYNADGNLNADSGEEINEIHWNIANKVRHVKGPVTGSDQINMEFRYGPMGNRILKIDKGSSVTNPVDSPLDWKHYWYVRDASGNVLAVYRRYMQNDDELPNYQHVTIELDELHIYGSDRLGMLKENTLMYSSEVATPMIPETGNIESSRSQPLRDDILDLLEELAKIAPLSQESQTLGMVSRASYKQYLEDAQVKAQALLQELEPLNINPIPPSANPEDYIRAQFSADQQYVVYNASITGEQFSQFLDANGLNAAGVLFEFTDTTYTTGGRFTMPVISHQGLINQVEALQHYLDQEIQAIEQETIPELLYSVERVRETITELTHQTQLILEQAQDKIREIDYIHLRDSLYNQYIGSNLDTSFLNLPSTDSIIARTLRTPGLIPGLPINPEEIPGVIPIGPDLGPLFSGNLPVSPGHVAYGLRRYELKNHLGNVMQVITDQKILKVNTQSTTSNTVFSDDFDQGVAPWLKTHSHYSTLYITHDNGKMNVSCPSRHTGAKRILGSDFSPGAYTLTFDLDILTPSNPTMEVFVRESSDGVTFTRVDIYSFNTSGAKTINFNLSDPYIELRIRHGGVSGRTTFTIDNLELATLVATQTKHYLADVIQYNDYFPFGMAMQPRSGMVDNQGYRYGFQGQEGDDELKGPGNSVNYKYRMHDPRIGRFFTVDPLVEKFPEMTPYQISGNKPVWSKELEGLQSAVDLEDKVSKDIDIGSEGTMIYKEETPFGEDSHGAILPPFEQSQSGSFTQFGLGYVNSSETQGNWFLDVFAPPLIDEEYYLKTRIVTYDYDQENGLLNITTSSSKITFPAILSSNSGRDFYQIDYSIVERSYLVRETTQLNLFTGNKTYLVARQIGECAVGSCDYLDYSQLSPVLTDYVKNKTFQQATDLIWHLAEEVGTKGPTEPIMPLTPY